MVMREPSRTTNRLHFSDLDPMRFEDLCLNMVSRLHEWKELNHYGRMGAENGVDISAVKDQDGIEKIWFIQCKRYLNINKGEITDIIDKVINQNVIPHKLLLIVSCDVSRATHQYFKDYATESGIGESELWTASVLEAKLYHVYKDLLFVYFGVSVEKKVKDNAAKIKYALRMEKRVSKELIDHQYIKQAQNARLLSYNPAAKFISSKVYIRSIEDTSYPEVKNVPRDQISPWFTTYFYDIYHAGIEFWLAAGIGSLVIMNEEGHWEPLENSTDKRRDDPQYRVIHAKMIGRIPYVNIVDFKTDGDEYSSEPHLFCRFDFDGTPYEEIYYKIHGNSKNEELDWALDKNMRTTFADKP